MSTEQRESLDNERSTERLEAFSDGVMAVAITLLVLNIQVPEVKPPYTTALQTMIAEWPTYLGYITSFIVVGLFWANHHYMFKYIKITDHFLLLLNTLTLMCLVLIPFATAFLTKEVQITNVPIGDLHLAAIVYGGTMLLTSIMYNILWRYASTKRRLIGKKLEDEVVQKMSRRYVLSIPLYLLTLVLSLINVKISFVFYLAIALFYALPTGALTFRKRPQKTENVLD
ncbi:MAG: TMEM175 family protein [Chloroflexota bacterium]|nr:TMEM175 family protein [Chloroflexota bacterium]